MPREQDVAALLKRLLAKEVTDADDNEVLDEIVALRDRLSPADAVTIGESADYRAVADVGLAGYSEACAELAVVDTQAEWQAGNVAMVDTVTRSGCVLLQVPYPPSATLTTGPLDLGGALPSRPVLLFPTMANDSPAETTATVTRYRNRSTGTDPWGDWIAVNQVPSGGALTAGPPRRYLEVEIQLTTTNPAITPALDRFGIYD